MTIENNDVFDGVNTVSRLIWLVFRDPRGEILIWRVWRETPRVDTRHGCY